MKKIAFSLLIVGLTLPMLSLAQSTDVYKLISPMAPTIAPIAPMINKVIAPEPVSGSTSGSAGYGSNVSKCGVNTFGVSNDCIGGAFKNLYVQCYDGYAEKQEADSCRTSSEWQEYAKKVCANRCLSGSSSASGGGSSASDILTPTKVAPAETSKTYNVPNAALPACYIGDDLMKQYDTLISELQNVQKTNDTERGNLITQKIIELKKEISASKTNCGGGSATSVSKPQPSTAPEVKQGGTSSGTVEMTKCEEVKRWEEKIAYYTKISGLADSDLKNQTNLSKDEIRNILASLGEGLQKVRERCNNVQATATTGATASAQAVSEPIKPVGVQSVQEIQSYYKAKIENITGTEDALEQVQQLKALKNDKDQLVGELIKNNKEIQASDLNAVAKEIKINKNEVVVDGMSVKMTGNRILLNIGSSSISIVSAGDKVIIKDKNLEVSTDGVSISDNSLKIGGVEVKLAASDVAEKLNVAPNAVELTTENSQPVYKMKIAEARKLFGFIKMDVQNTQTADANNGNLLNESKPWYYFLTTK